MNVVREINRINDLELKLGSNNASWHDEYKDSAYVYVGGLHFDLTEGDVITIMSQYGEIMDINMPRDKETGKSRGFAFVMYEDQRSTVLAVDNLNGAKVLEKTLRVDHVRGYKQPKSKNEEGEWIEPEEQSFNARPEMIQDEGGTESSETSGPEIDPEDPMYEYLVAKRREEKASRKKKKSKGKHKEKHANETPEERKARKAAKKARKAQKSKSKGVRGVEDLLASLGGSMEDREQERARDRPRDREREGGRDRGFDDDRYKGGSRRSRSRSRSPRRHDRDDADRRR